MNPPIAMSDSHSQQPTRPATDLSNGRDFLRWNAGFWLILAAVGWLIRLAITQSAEWSLVLTVVQDSVAFILSGALWLVLKRHPDSWPLGLVVALRITLLSLAAAMINAAVCHVFVATVGWEHPLWSVTEAAVFRSAFFWLAFMLWSSAWIAYNSWHRLLHESNRAAKAEAEAIRLELQMLRSRLAPHFLCNALNGITASINSDPAAARQMLCELADYLRFSLEQNQRMTVPLEDEFDALQHYLRIENSRFGEQLTVETSLDPAVADFRVPAFILQPLVENAVKYGNDPASGKRGTVKVAAAPVSGGVAISVTNSGQLDQLQANLGGTGLSIVQRSLELHYPGRHLFSLKQQGDSIAATIHIYTRQ